MPGERSESVKNEHRSEASPKPSPSGHGEQRTGARGTGQGSGVGLGLSPEPTCLLPGQAKVSTHVPRERAQPAGAAADPCLRRTRAQSLGPAPAGGLHRRGWPAGCPPHPRAAGSGSLCLHFWSNLEAAASSYLPSAVSARPELRSQPQHSLQAQGSCSWGLIKSALPLGSQRGEEEAASAHQPRLQPSLPAVASTPGLGTEGLRGDLQPSTAPAASQSHGHA